VGFGWGKQRACESSNKRNKTGALYSKTLMAYATYITGALMCGTWSRNTSDCSYLLFTREAGMLYADARSAREERSKQRCALQDFSLVRVSLIKGKQSWKIGSIEEQKNYYHQAVDKEARGSVVSLLRLLRRFVKGEEPAPAFYQYVIVQMAIQVQILALLGYVDNERIPETIRDIAPKDIIVKSDSKTLEIIEKLYTHAISVSHL